MPYGHHKAKVDLAYLASLADRPLGRLVLVTALSPTPPGEGKTTTTVGLTDALHGLGHRTVACLREPSMGPVFGMKGGAAGGGYSQVVPMTEINLHFTGDFAAIAAANNLLAALIDNHVHHGNELDIDVRSVTWKRVLDTNDRALREVTVGLGGHANGFPREDGFDIVVASELMAIFCLTESWADLKKRIGDIVDRLHPGHGPGDRARARRRRGDGRAAPRRPGAQPGADPRGRTGLRARRPLRQHRPRVQLGRPRPAPACGWPTSSSRRPASVPTSAPRSSSTSSAASPACAPTSRWSWPPCRALKYHGGVALADLGTEDVGALEAGMVNLRRHLDNVRDVYGIPCVVAVNRFPTDTDAEVATVVEMVAAEGVGRLPGDPLRRRRKRRPGPRQGRAGGASTSRRRTRSRSPTPTTSRSPRRSRRSPPGCTAPDRSPGTPRHGVG